MVVTESGEWLRGRRGWEGEGGRRVVVVMMVPVVVASDGVAVSLLRKAGLLDTASAARSLSLSLSLSFRARESCVIKINNSTTSMHSLVRDDDSICRPPAHPPRLHASSPSFSLALFLSPFLSPVFHPPKRPFYRTLLLNAPELVSKPSKRDAACRIMMRMHLTRR